MDKDLKEKIIKYIKLQHRQTCYWLQEHILKKFAVEINPNTIRTWKRQNNCLTNRKQCKKDWIEHIRNNYLKYSDKELAEILKNKFQRDITYHTVKHIRLKYHFYKPKKTYYRTIKEVRKCLNCSKDIKITCRNPHQKFCCCECSYIYQKKQYHERNMSVVTPIKIKNFINEYFGFSKKIIYENVKYYCLNGNDYDDLYSYYIEQIPSLLYHFNNKIKTKQGRKNYIAACIKNLSKKRYIQKEKWKENNVNIEDLSQKDFRMICDTSNLI